MKQHRSMATGGEPSIAPAEPATLHKERTPIRRMARAVVALVRDHRRLRHLPTLDQVRAMAQLDGREPCSYLLDRAVNFVPPADELPAGLERELGRNGLSFTCEVAGGRRAELVMFPCGVGFDLLGPGL